MRILISMSKEIEKLLKIIEQKLDWGKSETWQTSDFENLNQRILDETGVSLSTSTLRRIWGRVEYKNLPSSTTMNTLAKFAGYENWRAFIKQHTYSDTISPNTDNPPIKKKNFKSKSWVKIAWATVAVVVIISLISMFTVKKAHREINANDYSFSSQPLTREIPNSVIFTYDASVSPTDSVFIQQSWDPGTLTMVKKNLHKHTSVYYEPGFYLAKLFIGNQVVKEHKLIIPTNGWLGTIDNKPIPVYVKQSGFIYKDVMRLTVSEIEKNNIQMAPQPPVIKFFNVGNFEPVSVSNFSFSAEIKNEYKEGAAACQTTAIILVTDDNPIIIPLSIKGCVSELNLLCIDSAVSGKNADLSGLGVDFSNWANVSCKSTANKIQYYVNDKLAYECTRPPKDVHIVGMAYIFKGTGAVRNIKLNNKDSVVFHAF